MRGCRGSDRMVVRFTTTYMYTSCKFYTSHVGWLAGSLDTYLNDQFSKDKINQCLNIRQKIVDIINFTEKPELISNKKNTNHIYK
jgi:hypothetical protein